MTKFTLDRSTGIGASEIGALIVPDKYRTPHNLWLEKTGRSERKESLAMRMGKYMEPFILREAKKAFKEKGWPVTKIKANKESFRHSKFPHFYATPDSFGLFNGEKCVVETKYANDFVAEQFGEEGSDQCPNAYVVQVLWQMLCTGCRWGFLAVCLSNRKIALYQFDATESEAGLESQKLMKVCMAKADQFWHDNVLRDIAPPLTGYEADSDWVKKTYSYDDGSLCNPDEAHDAAAFELLMLRAELEPKELRKKELENQLKAFMGNSARMETRYGDFNYSTSEGGRRTFRAPTKPKLEVAA